MSEIRTLRFARRGDRYVPTRNGGWTFTAAVDTSTGKIVEPAQGGWRPAEHAPPHDPEQVLAWLEEERARGAAARGSRWNG